MKIAEKEKIGDKFQKYTKYDPMEMSGRGLDWSSQPETYKEYPEAEKLVLPKPNIDKNISLFDVLRNRKSIRNYSDQPITLDQLSSLLWAATGINRRTLKFEFRTAPSAGALYPIETYLLVNNIIDVESGVYHYDIFHHQLDLIKGGNFGEEISQAALDQYFCSRASVVFIFTAIFQRSKWKYEQRAYRYIYLDAGHIAENLSLIVTGLGLGGCHIAAIYDDLVNKILEINGENESAIYLMPIGNLKRK